MKFHTKLFTILTIFLLALFLAACSGSTEPEVSEEPAPQEEAVVEEAAEEEEAVAEEAVEEEEAAEEADASDEAMEEDSSMAGYAGLDQDLSGITIRMANIGGQPYEAMYDSISLFEEKTGATVEIVFLGDGFEIDRYLKTNYAAGTVDYDVAWNHTSFMSQFVNFTEPLNDYFTDEELAAFSPAIIEGRDD